ncbi:MAG: hypothetical protein HY686_01330 [Chloroflexi bacterium]|nr:hypothetical protein [Chloroflexota bacterium]
MATVVCSGCEVIVDSRSIACSRCQTPVGYLGGTPVTTSRWPHRQEALGAPAAVARPATPPVFEGERATRERERRVARAKVLLAEGKPAGDVIMLLLREEPVAPAEAQALVQEAAGRPLPELPQDKLPEVLQEGLDEEETSPGKDLLWGLIWLLGGGAVTLATYAAAAPGETYFIFYGAMLYGAFRLLKGMAKGVV